MLDHNVKSAAELIFQAVESPVAAQCREALKRNNPAEFGAIRVDPCGYSNPEDYFRDVQCVSFLKKLDAPDNQEELVRKAKILFQTCEAQCARTNIRMSDFVYNTAFYDGKDERLWTYVRRCKKLLRSWLGPLPTDLGNAKFGKGATYSDKGRQITIPDKMSSRPTITPNARFALDLWVRTSWFRALAYECPHNSEPADVEGNRFDTVPKDSTKRRCIAVEPSLNVFYQLGVGRVLRQRLKRLGIDLDRNQAVHRMIARIASRDGSFATLDLSNASDTVAYRLVQALLPPQWFELLDCLRSPKTQVDGRWYLLEKFSSMGNGFTFELETLIFLALLAGLDERLRPGENLYVYGDDIIIPTKYARSAVLALQWAGFTVNNDKSFTAGPFRESCGGDYLNGVAVRPCYLKETPSQPTDWIALANSLWRTAVEHNWSGDFELAEWLPSPQVLGFLHEAWRFCRSQIPIAYYPPGRNRKGKRKRPLNLRRCKGPSALGDVVLHTPAWEWEAKVRDSIRYFRAVIPAFERRRLREYPGSVALAALVYGVPSTGVVPRGARQWLTVREVPFS